MIYYYKRVYSCQSFHNPEIDDLEYIDTCKKWYNSGRDVDSSWLICNSKSGKCVTIDMSLFAGHSIVFRYIKRNPNLITDEEFMDYNNNPFRGSDHCSVIPHPVQTTKLKRKYEKSLHR